MEYNCMFFIVISSMESIVFVAVGDEYSLQFSFKVLVLIAIIMPVINIIVLGENKKGDKRNAASLKNSLMLKLLKRYFDIKFSVLNFMV